MTQSDPWPRPFQVDVPDAVLSDLRDRLARTRWPDEVPGGGWTYGTDLTYLRELAEYWCDSYDWRAQEAALNALPQYIAPAGGIDVHFAHVPGVGPDPLPLLLPHGWPGSFWEFHRIIPLLSDPASYGGDPADAFTVVAPSLPGYGFSFRPGQPRFGIPEIADVLAEVMTDVLGYRRFAVQGGDWGSGVAGRLALQYPERVVGIHLNLLFANPENLPLGDDDPEQDAYLDRLRAWRVEEAGYQAIQGTRPQTLAYGLTDSPVGLLAWIVEKFRAWSDCHGDVESVFPRDLLLTNVMLYWVTGAIGASFWPYYARTHGTPVVARGERVTAPVAHAAFPAEIYRPPRAVAEKMYNITRWTDMTAGGHFAALEQPAALAEDVRAFFRDLR